MKAKRLISLLLCVLMIGTLFPTGVFAAEELFPEGDGFVSELWIPDEDPAGAEPEDLSYDGQEDPAGEAQEDPADPPQDDPAADAQEAPAEELPEELIDELPEEPAEPDDPAPPSPEAPAAPHLILFL